MSHGLHAPTECLARCTLFNAESIRWKIVGGNQSRTWQKVLEDLTSGLADVDLLRLPR